MRDSAEIVQGLIHLARDRGTPFTVRLVKGAYWDYETILTAQEHWPPPVFLRKAETDAQFERLAKKIIDNWQWTRPALGTHNIRSIAVGMAAAEAAGLPATAVEIQVLHGMADSIRRAAVRQGYRVREYVPVGELIPGMAYLVRRLLENTANESFLRLTFAEHEDPESLLAPAGAKAGGRRQRPRAPRRHPPRARAHAPVPERTARRLLAGSQPEAPWRRLSRPSPRAPAATTLSSSTAPRCRPVSGSPPSTRPIPRQVVGRVAAASKAEVDRALDSAVGAFHFWRDTPAAERADILFKAAAAMRAQRFELAALEVMEAGKPWREADADVCEAIDFLEYYGREMLRLSEVRQLSDVPGESDLYFYEPRGVAAVIAPWNFPLAIPTGMVAAALVAGNSVVFKPATPTPGARLRDGAHPARGGRARRGPQLPARLGRRDRRLPGGRPARGPHRLHREPRGGPLDHGQSKRRRSGATQHQAGHHRDGRQERHHRRHRRRPGRGRRGSAGLGLRLCRAEVLGLQPRGGPRHHLRPVPPPSHAGDRRASSRATRPTPAPGWARS